MIFLWCVYYGEIFIKLGNDIILKFDKISKKDNINVELEGKNTWDLTALQVKLFPESTKIINVYQKNSP